MNINDSNFPMVKLLGYDSFNAPATLPLKTYSASIAPPARIVESLIENIKYIHSRNSRVGKDQHKTYFVEEQLFRKIDEDLPFRNMHFERFTSDKINTCTGTMLFASIGQIVYTILDQEETQNLKNVDGVYISIASFESNIFISYEEAIITSEAVTLSDIAYYSRGVQAGGMLSSVITFLSYLKTKKELNPLDKNSNETADSVYYVD
jgi:hypothetical protein